MYHCDKVEYLLETYRTDGTLQEGYRYHVLHHAVRNNSGQTCWDALIQGDSVQPFS